MHAVDAIECTAEGRGMPTIASMEREDGGVVHAGVKMERRTRWGGCGNDASVTSSDLALDGDLCEGDVAGRVRVSRRG
jgi:hypothetical protein